MNYLEHEIKDAIAAGEIPGTVLAATSKDGIYRPVPGSFEYIKPFGNSSLEFGSMPVSLSSTMCLASCTKLVTCVATMQCVERGLIGLDDDISTWLPEWKDALILKGFEGENSQTPILEKAKNPILLKHLLSHTSGITGFENEEIMKYYKTIGHTRATIIPRYFMTEDKEIRKSALDDMRKEMGRIVMLYSNSSTKTYLMLISLSSLSYLNQAPSGSMVKAWIGQGSWKIERLTNLTLEQYCAENIFKPLGIKNTTYRLLDHPHVAANLLKMTSRKTDGTLEQVDSIYPVDPEVDMGGSNLYTSAPDFLTLLKSLLRNDGRVLRPETADAMFAYRLPTSPGFRNFGKEEVKYHLGGLGPKDATVNHCLAGLINNQDLLGGRKAESITWSGATHCYWWIDKKAGICGFYGSQLVGIHDQGISKAKFEKFEKAVYEETRHVN